MCWHCMAGRFLGTGVLVQACACKGGSQAFNMHLCKSTVGAVACVLKLTQPATFPPYCCRLVEAGMEGATLTPGGPPMIEAFKWAVAAGFIIITGRRYMHHASEKVGMLKWLATAGMHDLKQTGSWLRSPHSHTAREAIAGMLVPQKGVHGRDAQPLPYSSIPTLPRCPLPATLQVSSIQEQRRAAEADASTRASLMRYEPLDSQRAFQAEQLTRLSLMGTPLQERLELAVHMMLGGRFMMASAATFAAFLATDNLLASFSTGLALQLASSVLCTSADKWRRPEA